MIELFHVNYLLGPPYDALRPAARLIQMNNVTFTHQVNVQ